MFFNSHFFSQWKSQMSYNLDLYLPHNKTKQFHKLFLGLLYAFYQSYELIWII